MLSKVQIIQIVVIAIVWIVVTSLSIYYANTSTTTTTTTTPTTTTAATTTSTNTNASTAAALLPAKSTFDEAMVSLCDSSPASQSQTGSPDRQSIYEGKLVKSIADYPWMVLLKMTYPTGFFSSCGATLIDDRHLLTAAHCVSSYDFKDGFLQYKEGEKITAHLGSTSRSSVHTPAAAKAIENAFIHIAYRRFVKGGSSGYVPGHRDIAVLRLNESLMNSPEWNTKIKPACLPTATEVAPSSCVVTGWGLFGPYQLLSPLLFMKDIQIINNYTECAKGFFALRNNQTHNETALKLGIDATYEDSIICSKGPDACQGDSGGPVVCKTKTSPDMKLFGIVSIGPTGACGSNSSTVPNVYINVPFFRSWLQYVALPALRNEKSSAAGLACLKQKCLDFGYVQLIKDTTDQRIKQYFTSWICRLFPPYYFCTFLDPKPERCQKTLVPKFIAIRFETPSGSNVPRYFRKQMIDSLKEITSGVSDLDTCTP